MQENEDLNARTDRLLHLIGDFCAKVGTGIDRIDRKVTSNTGEHDALLRIVARHLFDLRASCSKLADPLATSLSVLGYEEVRAKPRDKFNPVIHKEIESVPTPKQALHGLVQSSKRSGLSRSERAVFDFRALVAVYRYQPESTVQEPVVLPVTA